MEGGAGGRPPSVRSLAGVAVPLVVFHGVRDRLTDAAGSEALVRRAATSDKTLRRVGPGEDVDVDMFHNLASERGHGAVGAEAEAWLLERSRLLERL